MNLKVDELIGSINKSFSRVVVRSANDLPPVRRVPIGEPAVDYVLGGGIPINRVTEFYGFESSHKSYCAYRAIAKFQKFDFNTLTPDAITKIDYEEKRVRTAVKDEGTMEQTVYEPKKIHATVKNPEIKLAALVDYEGSFDPVWGAHLGVDIKGLLHLVPERGSQVVDLVESLLMQPEIGLVVLDSVGAASSDLEIDASAEDEQMGVNARFWNKAMRKFQAAMNSNPEDYVTLLVINRPYNKIGFVMGSPEQVGGGSGLRFAKSVSLSFVPLAPIKDEGKKEKGAKESTVLGRNVKVKCVKNKTARPFLEAEFYYSFVETDLYEKDRIDEVSQLVAIGLKTDVIERSGNHYLFAGTKVNGREAFAKHLRDNKLVAKLRKEVYAKFK